MSAAPRDDVNMRLIHAMTDYAALKIGKNAAIAATERALAKERVDDRTSGDPHAWVPLDALRAVADTLSAEVGGDVITDAITWIVPKRRDMSAMSLTALATPRMFYANIDRARSFFARHLDFDVELEGKSRARVTLRYRADVPRHAHSCEIARGVLHAVPLLFDLSPAEIAEHRCFAAGADACEYTVTWRDAPNATWIGAGIGAAVLAIGVLFVPTAWWVLAPIAGALAGRELRQTRLRRLMTRTTEEQRRVLDENEREFAARYDELRGANARLEERVLERTNELDRTLAQLREQNAYLRGAILELEKLKGELLDAGEDELLGDAVGELAHEFKTPLTVVSANLDFLEEGGPADIGELAEMTREMRTGVERMRTVLGWFVSIYRSTPAQLGPRELSAEVREAVAPLARQLGGTRLELDLHNACVAGHEGQLGQVVTNLVTNAARALGGRGVIRVEVRAENGRAILRVHDDGPGIAPELHEKVFERGFTTKRDGQASVSGLGLYIARTIVERHAGRISVRAGVPRGVTFEVDLPLLTEERDAPPKRASRSPGSDPDLLT